MKAHQLLLPKAPKRPDSGRLHDGVVAVVESKPTLVLGRLRNRLRQ